MGLSDKMFPRSAGPHCIYKLRFPVKRDGDLNRLLQNKPSAEGWRHAPSALKEREKECKLQEKKKARTETKEIKPSLLPGSISNLFFCLAQLTLREGKGGCSQSTLVGCLVPCITRVSTTATWGCLVLPSAVPWLGPSKGSAMENWV